MPGFVSSPVTLSSVKSVYNGPNNLGAYTRGGGYVPNDSASDGISTTTTGLRLSQFAGKFIPFVNVDDRNISNYKIGSEGRLTWGISTDGRAFWYKDNEPATYVGNVFTTDGTTLDTSGSLGYYEVYATVTSGTGGEWGFSISPLDTWLTLGGTAKSWTLRGTAYDALEYNLLVSIRRISVPGTVVDTANISYSLYVEL